MRRLILGSGFVALILLGAFACLPKPARVRRGLDYQVIEKGVHALNAATIVGAGPLIELETGFASRPNDQPPPPTDVHLIGTLDQSFVLASRPPDGEGALGLQSWPVHMLFIDPLVIHKSGVPDDQATLASWSRTSTTTSIFARFDRLGENVLWLVDDVLPIPVEGDAADAHRRLVIAPAGRPIIQFDDVFGAAFDLDGGVVAERIRPKKGQLLFRIDLAQGTIVQTATIATSSVSESFMAGFFRAGSALYQTRIAVDMSASVLRGTTISRVHTDDLSLEQVWTTNTVPSTVVTAVRGMGPRFEDPEIFGEHAVFTLLRGGSPERCRIDLTTGESQTLALPSRADAAGDLGVVFMEHAKRDPDLEPSDRDEDAPTSIDTILKFQGFGDEYPTTLGDLCSLQATDTPYWSTDSVKLCPPEIAFAQLDQPLSDGWRVPPSNVPSIPRVITSDSMRRLLYFEVPFGPATGDRISAVIAVGVQEASGVAPAQ